MQALTNNPRGGFNLREMRARDFYDNGFVIVGSAIVRRMEKVDAKSLGKTIDEIGAFVKELTVVLNP